MPNKKIGIVTNMVWFIWLSALKVAFFLLCEQYERDELLYIAHILTGICCEINGFQYYKCVCECKYIIYRNCEMCQDCIVQLHLVAIKVGSYNVIVFLFYLLSLHTCLPI